MKTIYKYPVTAADWFKLELPVGARILDVQTQLTQPFLWILVDTDEAFEVRKFLVLGTGHDAERVGNAKYIGTFQLNGGALVFHLFEATNG